MIGNGSENQNLSNPTKFSDNFKSFLAACLERNAEKRKSAKELLQV